MEKTAVISSSPSSSSAGPSTSTSAEAPPARSPEVMSEDDERQEHGGDGDDVMSPELVRQHTSTSSYRVPPMSGRRFSATTAADDLPADDTLSCVIVILTFWFFVSMTLIMGIFGSEDLQLGPYSSILLKPNPLFISYLKMEGSEEMKAAPVVYGFYEAPPLGITKTWSLSVSTSIRPDSHKEWVHYLNEGSQVNISYSMPSSSSLILVIAKGIEGLAEWVEDPLYPDSALSWNVIRGNGTIRQDILKSYDYYVGIGNFNSEDVEVALNFSVRSTMYDVTNSYYKCNLTHGACSLKIVFPEGNLGVLTTPGPNEGAEGATYVKLSYEPRWMTYFLGIGGMTSIMLWAFSFLNRIRRNNDVTWENQPRTNNAGSERAPLLSQKDDDVSSLGSSYDSGSQNDEEYQDYLEEGLPDGRSGGEGRRKYHPKQLCVICYDAPKDCFFIPCGHCASCFKCGVRIAEIAGTCPICRRRMKKVRRIYNV